MLRRGTLQGGSRAKDCRPLHNHDLLCRDWLPKAAMFPARSAVAGVPVPVLNRFRMATYGIVSSVLYVLQGYRQTHSILHSQGGGDIGMEATNGPAKRRSLRISSRQ
jgi:hypothetical protein